MKTLKELPKVKRPRERLEYLGVSNLTEIELIALLLGTGTKGEHVIEKSRKLLKQFSLFELSNCSFEDIIRSTCVGKVQAGKLVAAIEIGRRIFSHKKNPTLLNPYTVLQEVKDLQYKSQEYLLGLYLNARNELLEKHIIAVGTLNKAIIEPRDILHYALKIPASYIILVHNHPSGDPTPSEEDKKLTTTIVQACNLLGIMVVDHIVVASTGYRSFREDNLL